MDFPAAHRPKLHSTNPLERLNGDGIFPTRTPTPVLWPKRNAARD
jgi:hypothetical protein